MVFWSFLAGVVTFYCSLGPESLLPNIFVSIKPRTKVGQKEKKILNKTDTVKNLNLFIVISEENIIKYCNIKPIFSVRNYQSMFIYLNSTFYTQSKK